MNRDAALDEYYRVLKPDGIVILIENRLFNPFINIFRLHRQLTKKTASEINYVNSIKGYITSKEIDSFSSKFLIRKENNHHIFHMAAIYLRLKTGGSPSSLKLDSFLSRLDTMLLSSITKLNQIPWFTSLYLKDKKDV